MLHNVHAHIAHNAHSEAPKSSFGSSEQPVAVFFGSFCPGKRRKIEILSESLNRKDEGKVGCICAPTALLPSSFDCRAEYYVMMTCADLTP